MIISNSLKNSCLYFGCKSQSQIGHYLFDVSLKTINKSNFPKYNLTFNPYILDGFHKRSPQSVAHVIYFEGWSIAWMDDCSADSRGGSSSSFLVPLPNLNLEQILEIAKEAFPEQYKRISSVKEITSYK